MSELVEEVALAMANRNRSATSKYNHLVKSLEEFNPNVAKDLSGKAQAAIDVIKVKLLSDEVVTEAGYEILNYVTPSINCKIAARKALTAAIAKLEGE